MTYEIEDLESVLKNIKWNKKSIIYTENYLEKIERRKIFNAFVEDSLQFRELIFIKKLPDFHGFFLN